jgi:hypothetical protein
MLPTATTATGRHCPLLDLPVKTLQRITDLLDVHEAVPAARRTCKTLECETFERFVRASFSAIDCCILSEARWLRLKAILNGPARITSRIEKVDFTTCFFEKRDHSDLQLAPPQAVAKTYLRETQWYAFMDHDDAEAAAFQRPANIALMSSVLRDIKNILPPHVVTLHLTQSETAPNRHINAHRDALLALASTQVGLHLRGVFAESGQRWDTGCELCPSA